MKLLAVTFLAIVAISQCNAASLFERNELLIPTADEPLEVDNGIASLLFTIFKTFIEEKIEAITTVHILPEGVQEKIESMLAGLAKYKHKFGAAMKELLEKLEKKINSPALRKLIDSIVDSKRATMAPQTNALQMDRRSITDYLQFLKELLGLHLHEFKFVKYLEDNAHLVVEHMKKKFSLKNAIALFLLNEGKEIPKFVADEAKTVIIKFKDEIDPATYKKLIKLLTSDEDVYSAAIPLVY